MKLNSRSFSTDLPSFLWRRLLAAGLALIVASAGMIVALGYLGAESPVQAIDTTLRAAGQTSDCVNDTSAGSAAWTNPGNAATLTGNGATNSIGNGTTTNRLKCTGFDFTNSDIPVGSTINGIYLTTMVRREASQDIRDSEIRLVKAGSVVGDNKANTTQLWYLTTPPAGEIRGYGGTTDLWGTTWTQADVTSAGFGAVLTAVRAGGGPATSIGVGYLKIQVSYTPPPAPEFDQSAYRWFANYEGTATQNSAIIDSPGRIFGAAQRTMFWDNTNGQYWAFVNQDPGLEYFTSSDGSNWISRGTTAASALEYSVWHDAANDTVYLAYYDINFDIRVVKGAISASSITWSGLSSPINSASANDFYISQDNAGYLWVTWADHTAVYARRSSLPADTTTWSTTSSWASLSRPYDPVILPLTTNNEMALLYRTSDGVFVRDYNGSVWSGAQGGPNTANSTTFSAVSDSNDVIHLVTRDEVGKVLYYQYTSGTWSSGVMIASSTSASTLVDITLLDDGSLLVGAGDASSGDVYTTHGTYPFESGDWSTEQRLKQDISNLISIDMPLIENGSTIPGLVWYENNSGTYQVWWLKNEPLDPATQVDTALATQDTVSTAPSQGTKFRLRQLVHVDQGPLLASSQAFKLQVAVKSGTCDTSFTGESYADVSSTTGDIRFADNANADDGQLVMVNGSLDPTHGSDGTVAQNYTESNPTTTNSYAVQVGKDGLWDFVLEDYSAPTSTTYCFRMVKDDGSLLDTYSVIPEITTASAVEPTPRMDQLMRGGKWFKDGVLQPYSFAK